MQPTQHSSLGIVSRQLQDGDLILDNSIHVFAKKNLIVSCLVRAHSSRRHQSLHLTRWNICIYNARCDSRCSVRACRHFHQPHNARSLHWTVNYTLRCWASSSSGFLLHLDNSPGRILQSLQISRPSHRTASHTPQDQIHSDHLILGRLSDHVCDSLHSAARSKWRHTWTQV